MLLEERIEAVEERSMAAATAPSWWGDKMLNSRERTRRRRAERRSVRLGCSHCHGRAAGTRGGGWGEATKMPSKMPSKINMRTDHVTCESGRVLRRDDT
jgi:hypothetical protein